jgi:hypothetical protein
MFMALYTVALVVATKIAIDPNNDQYWLDPLCNIWKRINPVMLDMKQASRLAYTEIV